ncbi:Uncharacterized protein TXXE_07585 [Thermobacillus xylanilyticus]|jgi:hypothetical protein|uniref:Uncharacterized protein n=1 Tax=Thermobacillus xylanilyticus TaxID=76633 RepID=A0ABN7RUU1_THEXY|nr:hypothetical protein [Thermobacillus xylanilyticus]CAG5084200.1 Uncharacterized protein TXXE_07585 [Thermobacillus xylanilyticus]
MKRLLACAVSFALLLIWMALNAGDEPRTHAGFSNFYVIGTAAYQLFFYYFFIALPVSMWVDSILYRRFASRKALMVMRLIGHTISGLAVGWLLSHPLRVPPEGRLSFAAVLCLLMLLMIAIDFLLSIRIRRKQRQV